MVYNGYKNQSNTKRCFSFIHITFEVGNKQAFLLFAVGFKTRK